MNYIFLLAISFLLMFTACDQKESSKVEKADEVSYSNYTIEGVWETMGDTTGLQNRFGEDADSIFQILEKVATVKVALRKDKYAEMVFGYKAADSGAYFFSEKRDSIYIKLKSDKNFDKDIPKLHLLYDKNSGTLSFKSKSEYGDELSDFKKVSNNFYHILK